MTLTPSKCNRVAPGIPETLKRQGKSYPNLLKPHMIHLGATQTMFVLGATQTMFVLFLSLVLFIIMSSTKILIKKDHFRAPAGQTQISLTLN